MTIRPTPFTDAQMEAQYNLRLGRPDYDVAVVPKWVERSRETRRALPCRLGIAYGPSERTKLDVFPAPGEGNPVLLYFHGGYWQRGSREDYSFLAEPFVAAGVTVVMAGYDLCPDVTMTELVAQTRAAAAYTWRYVQEWGGDRTKMTVMGHSAGGHITGMLIATDWSQVDTDMPRAIFRAAIPVSPLNDLAPLRPTTLNKALKITDAEVDELSPQDLPPIDDAPQLVVVGARETEEFHRQADNYVAAYRTPARVMERLSVRDCDHFDLMDELADPQSEFFLRSLSFITATEGA